MPTLSSSFKTFVLIIICFCFVIKPIQANVKESQQTRETCQKLIDEGWEEVSQKKYAPALEKLLKAEVTATANKWDEINWNVKNKIGLLYTYVSNYSEAVNYFQSALTITRKNKNLRKEGAIPLLNLGVLYIEDKSFDEALISLNNAKEIADKYKTELSKEYEGLMINFAVLYTEMDQPKISLRILDKTSYTNGFKNTFYARSAYIVALIKNDQLQKATKMTEDLYRDFKAGIFKDFRNECYLCMHRILAGVYKRLGEYDLA